DTMGILQNSVQYFIHTDAQGAQVAPVASDTVYRRENDNTSAETTTYAYSWFANTNQMQIMTITQPPVSGSENGPDSSDTEDSVYDTYDRLIWKRDGVGFVIYTTYV